MASIQCIATMLYKPANIYNLAAQYMDANKLSTSSSLSCKVLTTVNYSNPQFKIYSVHSNVIYCRGKFICWSVKVNVVLHAYCS